ncbi:unnamed protein product [Urochloa humidicola]
MTSFIEFKIDGAASAVKTRDNILRSQHHREIGFNPSCRSRLSRKILPSHIVRKNKMKRIGRVFGRSPGRTKDERQQEDAMAAV